MQEKGGGEQGGGGENKVKEDERKQGDGGEYKVNEGENEIRRDNREEEGEK